jgi:hypothetical protein
MGRHRKIGRQTFRATGRKHSAKCKQSGFVVSGQFPTKSHSPRRKPKHAPVHQALLKAFDNVDPRRVARAITATPPGNWSARPATRFHQHCSVAANIITEGAFFFFAMNLNTVPKSRGKTKCVERPSEAAHKADTDNFLVTVDACIP